MTVLKKGDDGVLVVQLQELLTKHGFTCIADGDFGNGTEAKVKEFQQKKGLLADGVVGKISWNALGVPSAEDNKWLIVQDSVVLTPVIEPVIVALDKYFEEANHKAYVTSGLRDSKDQLRIIKGYLVRKGLDKKYPEAMSCDVNDKLPNGDYVWQMAWSNLLNINVIINPPLPATVLMNYIRGTVNRKGKVIGSSPHAPGLALDIGGGGNGINDELAIILKAMKDKKIPGLRGYLAERENNCLHVDCQKA